jgi:phage/plasmid-like protein (TIGR03299 family)
MAHMVETMGLDVSVLGASWHGLENSFNGLKTALECMNLSGINWTVGQAPIFVNGTEVPGMKANVRSSDNVVLGIVSDVYKPIQNHEAFSFVDSIIGTNDAKFNSAGCLYNKYTRPSRIWISAELKPISLMGDTVKNYLVFSHSHDGLNAVKCFVTPVRVVCNNTLTMAIDGTQRSWSCKHAGDVTDKMNAAQQTLKLSDDYIAALPIMAETMNSINLYDIEVLNLLETLFPDDGTQGKTRLSQNAGTMRDDILKTYNFKEDIKRFSGTAWGMYQAITDVIEHRSAFRQTSTSDLNRSFKVIEGHPVTMRAQKLLMSIKA